MTLTDASVVILLAGVQRHLEVATALADDVRKNRPDDQRYKYLLADCETVAKFTQDTLDTLIETLPEAP